MVVVGVIGAQVAACRLGFEDAGVDARADGVTAVSNLRPEWVTAYSIMWRWEWTGDETAFERFELVVGPSQAAVETRTSGTRVLGPADRPELDHARLPDTGDMNPVERTLADELEPDTDVWAVLVAVDTAGGSRTTAPAMVHTPPAPTAEIVLYADDHPPGSYPIPGELVESTVGPYAGARTNRYDGVCPGGDCFENLRRQDLGIATGALPASAFDRAFVEVWVANGSATPSYWSDVRLYVGGCGPLEQLYGFAPITLRNDDVYHPLQVALSALASPAGPLTHATFATGVCGWWVGGRWSLGDPVRIDEVRIRW
jgi:hypothetical protein